MPRAIQQQISHIQRLPDAAARQAAYRALATSLEQARTKASLLQQKYALGLWLRHVRTLAADEQETV
jgi:hypothetical protein